MGRARFNYAALSQAQVQIGVISIRCIARHTEVPRRSLNSKKIDQHKTFGGWIYAILAKPSSYKSLIEEFMTNNLISSCLQASHAPSQGIFQIVLVVIGAAEIAPSVRHGRIQFHRALKFQFFFQSVHVIKIRKHATPTRSTRKEKGKKGMMEAVNCKHQSRGDIYGIKSTNYHALSVYETCA